MSAGDGPPRERGEPTNESLLTQIRTAERGPLFVLREVGTSVLTVAVIGLLLFGISGVWPPMVAVESGSMDPNMHKGDLVFVTDPGRFAPDDASHNAGVVPYRTATETEYRQFGSFGSVIVYNSPGQGGPPVIHRARFWVSDGENWYDKANTEYVGGAENCNELRHCPAPHAGFVTKGDANPTYDQVNGISSPVKPGWIVGVARVRIPWLGWIRLIFSGSAVASPVDPGTLAGAGTAAGPANSVVVSTAISEVASVTDPEIAGVATPGTASTVNPGPANTVNPDQLGVSALPESATATTSAG